MLRFRGWSSIMKTTKNFLTEFSSGRKTGDSSRSSRWVWIFENSWLHSRSYQSGWNISSCELSVYLYHLVEKASFNSLNVDLHRFHLQKKATDPARFTNRGGNLLKEEKQRSELQKHLPKVKQRGRNIVIICLATDCWFLLSCLHFKAWEEIEIGDWSLGKWTRPWVFCEWTEVPAVCGRAVGALPNREGEGEARTGKASTCVLEVQRLQEQVFSLFLLFSNQSASEEEQTDRGGHAVRHNRTNPHQAQIPGHHRHAK